MAKQTLICTCLPNGVSQDGKGLRVSVLISPRLDPGADRPQLSSFDDWLDWPATLNNAVCYFSLPGKPQFIKSGIAVSTGPARHDGAIGAPDSVAWRALFQKELHVDGSSAALDVINSDVLSYSSTDVHDLVRDLYVDLARRSGTALPRIGADLLNDPAWRELVEAVRQVDALGSARHFETSLPAAAGEAPTRIERRFAVLRRLLAASPLGSARTGLAAKVAHLARFELFQTPPLRPKPLKPTRRDDGEPTGAVGQEFERPPLPTAEELAKRMDFHGVVASMNAYPTLQRRLGLVIDFIIDRRALQQGLNIELSAEVHLPAATTPIEAAVSPVTHLQHDDETFCALAHPAPQPDQDNISHGLLDLYSQPGRFAVLQADVDGAGHKLMNFARTLGGYSRGSDTDPAFLLDDVSRHAKEAGAPALRTAGLMLVRKDRAKALGARFDANRQQKQQAAQGGRLDLWAEDLVRGYRLDAWDAQTRVWRSLCRRSAEYRLANGTLVVSPQAGEEEATVQLAATRAPDPSYLPGLIWLHEAMVSWTGWSLGAPPPGKGIGDDTAAPPGGKPPFVEEGGSLANLDFRSSFRALPGSLPRLRYGRSYALRARAVDLAGNSVPASEQDIGPEQPATEAQAFLRFEPLTPPALALARPQQGATELPQEGESMHRLAIRSFNQVFNDPTPTPQVARRYAVPPQSTVREAELHGKLDQAGVPGSAMFQMLAFDKDRDAGDPAAALVTERVPMQGPDDRQPIETTYAVWREGMAMTYLPDPMADVASAWFIGHPTMPPDETLHIPLYPNGQRWPETQPFGIALYEDAADAQARPVFDSSARVLRIPLAKGARATLRLSMRPSKHDLFARMGVWQWLDGATRSALVDAALDGRCWLFSPWQDVELVHAVQRPLIVPAMRALRTEREPNATFALPCFLAACSLPSTDRLDLLAHWHEPVDDPQMPALQDRARDDLAFHIKITETRDYVASRSALPDHSLGDAPNTVGVNTPASDLLAAKRHEFNDTRYRRIEYRLVGTSRYREYLPLALLQEPDASSPTGFSPVSAPLTLDGPAAVTWIQSSAPPPAPKLLYLVPTFGWERTQDAAGSAHSRRRGGGLRVYLDRPWNASGYGEMLAVVLPPANFGGDPALEPGDAPYKTIATQWGNDPVWQSPLVAGIAPTRSHFPRARWQADAGGGWLPPGAPPSEADQAPGAFEVRPQRVTGSVSTPVEIAPHDVFYDADRQLWYCDIEIDQGPSYWPFVRLALARYQPCSVRQAHLSEIVLADFMPLTADRWLTVNAEQEGRSRRVTVHGARYSDSRGAGVERSEIDPVSHVATNIAARSKTPVVEVWLELLDPALGEDFGWRRVADGVAAANTGTRRAAAAYERFNPLATVLWDGRVELPMNDGESALRLVVAEYEEYSVDGDSTASGTRSVLTGRRLVFVEHIDLSPVWKT